MLSKLSPSPPSSLARTVFRIAYRTLYFIIYILLLGLLLLTPADFIQQAHANGSTFIIWIVACCVPLTGLIQSFIYALRLYANQAVLAAIPKHSINLAHMDVPPYMLDVVASGLDRTAKVARLARPPVLPLGQETLEAAIINGEGIGQLGATDTPYGGLGTNHVEGRNDHPPTGAKNRDISARLLPPGPVWGKIEHLGWSSPMSTDLTPSLHFDMVILELPNLVEQKAIYLNPRSSSAVPASALVDVPDKATSADPVAVEMLQRLPFMTFRDYLGHLAGLGVSPASPTTAALLSAYEYARFSTRPLSSALFRDLLRLFARVLDAMQPLDPAILDSTVQSTSTSSLFEGGNSESDRAETPSPRQLPRNNLPREARADFYSAPSSPRLNFAQTRAPYEPSIGSVRSSSSANGFVN